MIKPNSNNLKEIKGISDIFHDIKRSVKYQHYERNIRIKIKLLIVVYGFIQDIHLIQ